MATVWLTPAQFPKHMKWLGKQLKQATLAGLRAGAHRGRTLLVQRTPKGATGVMRNAWRVPRTGPIVIENDAPYAGIVELGARPHPVSDEGREAIRLWVVRKLLSISMDVADQNEEVDRIVEAICRKLRLYGQAPTYLTRGSLPEIKRLAQIEVERLHRAIATKKGPGQRGGGGPG